MRSFHVVIVLVIGSLFSSTTFAAELPQRHEYQQQLRDWLASLTVDDLAVEIQPFREPGERSAEEMHRLWTLTQLSPPFDVGLPAEQFLLENIETDEGIILPSLPRAVAATAWLPAWDDPINRYHGNAALKRRALVWAAVDMMMLDEHHQQGGGRRSDFLGGTLIWTAFVYKAAGDVLPEPAAEAYEQGLRRMVDKLETWGPTGAMTDMDLFAPVGLWYAAEAIGDPELFERAEAYSRQLFTEPRYFHPAGYFVDVGGYDVSYNGISLYFAAHAAVATRWDFVTEALSKAYELRRYMVFPDPAFNKGWGPSSYSPRTSAAADAEQWNRGIRHTAAAMFTDEAMGLVPEPTDERLEEAMALVVRQMESRNKPTDREPTPWQETHWSSDLPFTYDHYVDGFYERRLAVQESNPEVLVGPYQREGTFVRNFGDVLLAAKMPDFGVIAHTGPIGRQGPPLYGFSGGSLAGFWTPEAGPVILGRRSGSQGGAKADGFHNWRLWPVHSVSGTVENGGAEQNEQVIIATARVTRPTAEYSVSDSGATMHITGAIRPQHGANGQVNGGQIQYERSMELDATGLSMQTTLGCDALQQVSELYESLPIFHGPPRGSNGSPVHLVLARQGDRWVELDREPVVTDLVRIERHEGAVHVQLDQPRPVRLSDEMWQDQYQSRVQCHNLLIDLLGESDRPVAFDQGSTITSGIQLLPADDIDVDRDAIDRIEADEADDAGEAGEVDDA